MNIQVGKWYWAAGAGHDYHCYYHAVKNEGSIYWLRRYDTDGRGRMHALEGYTYTGAGIEYAWDIETTHVSNYAITNEVGLLYVRLRGIIKE